MFIQKAINKIKEETNLGSKLMVREQVYYANTNDIAIIDENMKDLQVLIRTMDKTFNNDLRMKINMQKTKVLVYGREKVYKSRYT